MIITLTDEQIENNPYLTKDGKAGFYNLIRELCKTETHEIDTIDCTKINVATNIQKKWYEYAEKYMNTTDLTMHLCFAGPKALEHLTDNTVEILDNCFTYKPIEMTQ